MVKKNIIGIDMGGTNVRAGLVCDNELTHIISKRINSQVTSDEVLQQLFSLTDELIDNNIESIGIGVPGLVNAEEKMVYDVVYIPAWKKIPLQQLMQDRYQIPVYVENDANCFALGEYYFGKGQGYHSMIGLTLGTGLGSGLIINQKLYAGKNGGAGEFGVEGCWSGPTTCSWGGARISFTRWRNSSRKPSSGGRRPRLRSPWRVGPS